MLKVQNNVAIGQIFYTVTSKKFILEFFQTDIKEIKGKIFKKKAVI